VIVHDFYFEGIPIFPTEADSPLVIDPNAVLARSVTIKLLQAVAGQGQVSQAGCRIQLLQLPNGLISNASKRLGHAQFVV
jgi:hypothetical protein